MCEHNPYTCESLEKWVHAEENVISIRGGGLVCLCVQIGRKVAVINFSL